MPTTRPSFASLGLAPLILRIVVGGTFLWAGLGKWMATIQVQGEDAAMLANLDILDRPASQPPIPAAPAPAAPLPTPSGGHAAAGGSIFLLAQVPAAGAGKVPPVTAGPALMTAADYPGPVPCRAMWGIALAVHHAAHSAPGGAQMRLWPQTLGEGLWPKCFAVAVLIAELGGGACMVIGLFTRLAAFAGAGVMLGAIWLTQIGPAVQSGQTLLGFLPAHDVWDARAWMPMAWQTSLLGSSLALMCLGCGALALDRMIAGFRDSGVRPSGREPREEPRGVR
jgi:uncharacterized membrane protein YphA (DoxX/SURF4 family)